MRVTFEEWMRLVDAIVQRRTGMSAYDLDDWSYRDDYEDRLSPVMSANRAIRNAKEACGF